MDVGMSSSDAPIYAGNHQTITDTHDTNQQPATVI